MRVLFVGGSGALGRRIVPELVARGHEVAATSRHPGRREALAELGAEPLILDALDGAAVDAAVGESGAEVVVCQVTSLSGDLARIGELVAENARVRRQATLNVLAAAERFGVRRLVAQGIAFGYAPGVGLAAEDDPPGDDATARAAAETDAAVLGAALEGVVARYGYLYGPGTWYARDGAAAAALREGALPAGGHGNESLVHVDDAAAATVLLCERGASGAYNVVDDDPFPRSAWLAALAAAVGTPPPATADGPSARGASNAKLRALGWKPMYPSWREGFRAGL